MCSIYLIGTEEEKLREQHILKLRFAENVDILTDRFADRNPDVVSVISFSDEVYPQRFRGTPTIFPPLIHSDVRYASIVSGGSLRFIRIPVVYHPLFLELKRIIHSCSLGAFCGADLFFALERDTSSAFVEGLILLYWLFGPPEHASFSAAVVGQGISQIAGTFRAGAAGGSVVLAWVPGSAGIQKKGFLSFEDGSLEFALYPGARLLCHDAGTGTYVVPLPEGNGEEYLYLDAFECVKKNRESAIIPFDIGVAAYAWASNVMRNVLP